MSQSWEAAELPEGVIPGSPCPCVAGFPEGNKPRWPWPTLSASHRMKCRIFDPLELFPTVCMMEGRLSLLSSIELAESGSFHQSIHQWDHLAGLGIS